MATVDLAGFISQLKDHAVEHGYHIHDERHYVETYSLRQSWEVDLHPENACNGPLDIHVALEVDPRLLLGFEDAVLALGEDADPPSGFELDMSFNWTLPPVTVDVDVLGLTLDLSGLGGLDFPIEVSAVDSYPSVTDTSSRKLAVIGHYKVELSQIYLGDESTCDVLETSSKISTYLLEKASEWLIQG